MATYQEQIARRQREKETKAKSDADRKMTSEQIDHWRGVLWNMGVPFAMTMPVEMVQRFRDVMQARINAQFAAPNVGTQEEK